MLENLPIGALTNGIGVIGVVVLVWWMLSTGRLYTRASVAEERAAHIREVERMEKAHGLALEDAQHERGEWRTEARLNQQTVVELTEQNQAMLSAFGPTLSDFLDSLRKVASRVRDEVDEERDRV